LAGASAKRADTIITVAIAGAMMATSHNGFFFVNKQGCLEVGMIHLFIFHLIKIRGRWHPTFDSLTGRGAKLLVVR
jgi:hypothetical protein